MKQRNYVLGLVVLAAGLTITALANGRKPVANIAVKATVETSDGKTHEIFNVHITGGTNDATELQARDGVVKQVIKLSQIEKIVFLSPAAANTNFAVFDVFKTGSTNVNRLEVKINDNGNPLSLSGMTREKTSLEVALTDCKAVAFSPQGELHNEKEWPVVTPAQKK